MSPDRPVIYSIVNPELSLTNQISLLIPLMRPVELLIMPYKPRIRHHIYLMMMYTPLVRPDNFDKS